MTEQERIEKMKTLINEIADCYELDEEKAHQVLELCDVDWDAEDIQMMCFEYWESPFTIDQIAYFLIHGEHKKADGQEN